jgi:hypothetical protein
MGRTQDYLDRGHPSPRERAETEAWMREKRHLLQQLERRYTHHLDILRQIAPAAVRAWIERHLATLEVLMQTPPPEMPPNFDLSLRDFVAQQAVDAWQEVLAGTREYVHINSYYLSDYELRFDELEEVPS